LPEHVLQKATSNITGCTLKWNPQWRRDGHETSGLGTGINSDRSVMETNIEGHPKQQKIETVGWWPVHQEERWDRLD
jgi:hypothetical protein